MNLNKIEEDAKNCITPHYSDAIEMCALIRKQESEVARLAQLHVVSAAAEGANAGRDLGIDAAFIGGVLEGNEAAPQQHAQAALSDEHLPQPFACAVTLLETIAEYGCVAKHADGAITPNADLCLRLAGELRLAASHQPAAAPSAPPEVKQDDFMHGVIAALGALAPHSQHGCTEHDEIVHSVGKEALYRAAEPEDVAWAALDREYYAEVQK